MGYSIQWEIIPNTYVANIIILIFSNLPSSKFGTLGMQEVFTVVAVNTFVSAYIFTYGAVVVNAALTTKVG